MSEQTRQVLDDSSCFVGPITSLQLLSSTHNDRLLLVGSGSFLSVFSLAACSSRNPEPVLYRKLLAADRIHHIKPLEYHGEQPEEERRAESPFVCAGGREFAICSIECLAEVDAKDGETTHPSRMIVLITPFLLSNYLFRRMMPCWIPSDGCFISSRLLPSMIG
ncbi:hypothetical protein PGTUg99_010200 [Puccinia graminis f. sp. tritici]|uniref:Uncharacterized protein n=1 Tax=Puccinia graminis f. sp. tritici TaxID=56615 RepID=A0A5B0M474_PUCGR|nr:hypothetical protein PGTUg99_010200 [Puccinia graminis f. sp. tritici]